ncbi:MAG: histidine kinase [Bacteroidia bacterium]|nr:histidine kinase [Bacteroidia bacterium]
MKGPFTKLITQLSTHFLLIKMGLVVICLFLFSRISIGQGNDLTIYSVEDGLAQSQVYAMLEDPRGFLWLGTQGGGISKFDGLKFTSYNTRDGLLSNYIFSLHYGKQDVLWIGTNVGLSRFDGIRFQSFMAEGQEPLEIRSIIEPEDGQILLGTNKGVWKLEGDELQPLNQRLARLDVHVLKQGNNQNLWVGHKGGLMYLSESDTFAYGTAHGIPGSGICDVQEDSMGNLYLASLGDGLFTRKGNRFEQVYLPELPEKMLIWDLFQDKKGRLWLGTLKYGAISVNLIDSSLFFINDQKGLLKNHVHSILEDEWGTIWMGSSGGGLTSFAGQEFVHFGRNSELDGQSVYALTIDQDSNLWFSMGNKGLGLWNGKNFFLYDEIKGYRNLTIRTLFTDRQGYVWAGTDGEGIFVIRDSTVDHIDRDMGLSTPWVRDMVQDKDGYIWVATTGGVARITYYQTDPKQWKYAIREFTIEDGLPSNRVNCLYKDLEDRIWYGLDGQGIGFIEKDSLVRRVPLEESRARKIVRCMREDTQGHLWVGTGGGVSRLSIYEPLGAPDWVHYSDKLTSTNIYLLAINEKNEIWIGSEQGLDQAKLDDKLYIIDVRHYGIADGFLGVETCRNAVIKDYEGNYWFGTISGLTRYNPKRDVKNVIPPKLSIKGIDLFYSPMHQTKFANWMGPWNSVKPGLSMPHKSNHLSFEFIGINYPNPEQVTYQWMLQNLEEDWSPASSKQDATYSNIPPGSYVFRVRAANEEGLWSAPIEIPFSVRPPYWSEWWFQLGAILVIALLIFVFIRLRINRVQRQARIEKERLIMEKSMIELEQKALRLQMNPHFIFHALNSINGLITLDDTRTARYYLSKFSHLMRQVLENSREGSISLATEVQTLENYLALERFSREQQFDYEIIVKEDIPTEEVYIPPMIVQPFVENAIIHGVSHLIKKKGTIHVCFEQLQDEIRCSVVDNGIGRSEAEKFKSQKNEKKKSTALLVTQERLDLLQNEGSHRESSIKIQDLVDAKGDAAGTQISIIIPVVYH